jgi:hypothetical protein
LREVDAVHCFCDDFCAHLFALLPGRC